MTEPAAKAMKNLNDTYERLEHYDNTHIHTSSYAFLNIKCGALLFDSDENHWTQRKIAPRHFRTPGRLLVPNITIKDDLMRETFQVFNNSWDAALTSPLMRGSPETQASHVCSWLEHMFSYFQRESSHPENVGWLAPLNSIQVEKQVCDPAPSRHDVLTTLVIVKWQDNPLDL